MASGCSAGTKSHKVSSFPEIQCGCEQTISTDAAFMGRQQDPTKVRGRTRMGGKGGQAVGYSFLTSPWSLSVAVISHPSARLGSSSTDGSHIVSGRGKYPQAPPPCGPYSPVSPEPTKNRAVSSSPLLRQNWQGQQVP